MSDFNKYAKRLDALAKEAFKVYTVAEQELDRRQKSYNEYPKKYGFGHVTDSYIAESEKRHAALIEAKRGFEDAKSKYRDYINKIADLRKEFIKAIDEHFSANPKAINSNTAVLLQSGALACSDYQKLLQQAFEDENYTMVRLIGKSAEDLANAEESDSGEYNQTVAELRAVANRAKGYNGTEIVQKFDALATTFGYCVNNPLMIEDWGMLTSELVTNF